MTSAWLQFNYDAKMKHLKEIMEKATRYGYVINPKKVPEGSSKFEWYSTWVHLLITAVEASEKISLNSQLSMLIIPAGLLPIISMAPGFDFAENKGPITGPYLDGTLSESLSIIVCPGLEDNKVYAYDVPSGNSIVIELE